MARLHRPRGAGRTGGGGDPGAVEMMQHRLAIGIVEGDIAGIGQALRAAAIDAAMWDFFEESELEPIAQVSYARMILRESLAADFGRHAQADNAGRIFRAGAPS